MLEGVIFDLDGLMFDTEPVWLDAWVPALESVGVEYHAELAAATRGTSGKSLDAVINRYLPNVDAALVREKLGEAALDIMAAGVPKKPGLDELLAFLEEQGLPLAVASSSSLDFINMHLRKGDVRKYFSKIVSGANIEHPKPEPDIFLMAAKAIGVEPAHTLVLEDSNAGVSAGVAGGFITVMVPDMDAPTDEVRATVSHICKDLYEVRELIEAGKLG